MTVGRVAAAAVTDRAGHRARRLRADEQRALAHPRDRAAARADALHVDHREPDVVAVAPVPVGLDLRAGRRARGRCRSWCRPCRRRRSRRASARSAASVAPITPPVGPRREQRDRAARDVVGRHHAAGRLHDQQRSAVARAAQLVLEVAGVVRDARRDVRVHERGRHPLELGSARHAPRARARCARRRGTPRARSRASAARARGFTNENRYMTAIERTPSFFRRCTPRRTASSSSGRSTVALEVHALGDRDARPAAGDRARARIVRVPDLFLVAAPQLDLVAVALGDEQAGGRAVHLDHRVVGGRGAVHEDVELARRTSASDEAEAVGELAEPVHHAASTGRRAWSASCRARPRRRA